MNKPSLLTCNRCGNLFEVEVRDGEIPLQCDFCRLLAKRAS